MILVQIACCALAGWRLASLLVMEDGPWGVFLRIRKRAHAEFEVEGFFGELLSCMLCTGFWTSIAMYALYYFAPWAVGAIAASGLLIMIERWIRR